MQIKIQPFDHHKSFVAVDDSGNGGIVLEAGDPGENTCQVHLNRAQADALKVAIDACLAQERPMLALSEIEESKANKQAKEILEYVEKTIRRGYP